MRQLSSFRSEVELCKMYHSSLILKLGFVLLLSSLGAASAGQSLEDDPTPQWPCPIAEKIAPCVCTWDENYYLYMDCSAATTVEELSNAFSTQFPFDSFRSLTIDQTGCTNCTLTALRAGVFGTSVSFLEAIVTKTDIEVIEEQVFTASRDRLTTLRLPTNKLHTFPAESIESYSALAYIYLNNNSFSNSDPLRSLNSERLTIINLSSNNLSVPPDFVSNCPAVRQVRLRNMQLPEIPVFDASPISMFRGLQKIELVDLGRNFFTEVQTDALVADAATFKTVDLAENQITLLHPRFVTGFSSQASVNLNMSRNSLSRLEQTVWEDIFTEISQDESVDLSNNPLLCGCDIAWLVSSPLKSSLTNTTTCASGTPVKDLTEDAFADC